MSTISTFIINYDLISNRDYSTLYDAIENYGCFAHILESVWIIKSYNSSTEIRDNLKSYIDFDDKLFVAKLDNESAWLNLSDEVSGWIKVNT